MYLGLELEINVPRRRESVERIVTVVRRWLADLGYLKHDNTISHGFEIVTHPMSYRWAIAHFPWDMLAEIERLGGHADGVGLHVHINRDGLDSPEHIWLWMELLYRNRDQVITLARRRADTYAPFADRHKIQDYARGARGDTRYRAINASNEATFELRFFASSLDRREVRAALGLAAASVEYTRELASAGTTDRGRLDWSEFMAWLPAHPEYTPLAREVRRRLGGGDSLPGLTVAVALLTGGVVFAQLVAAPDAAHAAEVSTATAAHPVHSGSGSAAPLLVVALIVLGPAPVLVGWLAIRAKARGWIADGPLRQRNYRATSARKQSR